MIGNYLDIGCLSSDIKNVTYCNTLFRFYLKLQNALSCKISDLMTKFERASICRLGIGALL